MVITGYRIDTMDLQEVMKVLDKVKKKISTITNRVYNELLGEEIAFINDNIILGSMQRGNGSTIFDDAVKNINYKMNLAKNSCAEVKYNFHIFAHIMPYENHTYIKVVSPNVILLGGFKGVEDFSLDEIECQDKANNKTIIWNKLHEIYGKTEPLVINLSATPEVDKEKIKYPTVKERAETRARHSLTNHLLNIIGGGQQIPPVLLMPYMDMAFEMMESQECQSEYRKKVQQLSQIFNDLTTDNDYIYENKEVSKVE